VHLSKELNTPVLDVWRMDAYEFVIYLSILGENPEDERENTKEMASIKEIKGLFSGC
jgi:hypothetical protein